MPVQLNTPGKRALFNNLSGNEDLALKIDAEVRNVCPADWRGNVPRENIIKQALLPLLDNNQDEVERIFLIIKHQRKY